MGNWAARARMIHASVSSVYGLGLEDSHVPTVLASSV